MPLVIRSRAKMRGAAPRTARFNASLIVGGGPEADPVAVRSRTLGVPSSVPDTSADVIIGDGGIADDGVPAGAMAIGTRESWLGWAGCPAG
jgi:hypothetical protein